MANQRKHYLREDFLKGKLEDIETLNPMEMFSKWHEEAIENDCFEPHTVTLSTSSKDGKPAARIVYLREQDDEGFIFYTNYTSRKGIELVDNPHVALLFYWPCTERQVRIEGVVSKISEARSDEYFESRPRISKVGAWASQQSQRIEDRKTLEERVAAFDKKYPNEVPRPPHWGGLIVKPTYFEFWQGRKGRLHDRICFEGADKKWQVFRLAP